MDMHMRQLELQKYRKYPLWLSLGLARINFAQLPAQSRHEINIE